jgi:hypothetical protein
MLSSLMRLLAVSPDQSFAAFLDDPSIIVAATGTLPTG